MTYALSFVKHDICICAISNKDMYSGFVFDVIDPIKLTDVWIKFPVDVLMKYPIGPLNCVL